MKKKKVCIDLNKQPMYNSDSGSEDSLPSAIQTAVQNNPQDPLSRSARTVNDGTIRNGNIIHHVTQNPVPPGVANGTTDTSFPITVRYTTTHEFRQTVVQNDTAKAATFSTPNLISQACRSFCCLLY